jgi:hypothetical protein
VVLPGVVGEKLMVKRSEPDGAIGVLTTCPVIEKLLLVVNELAASATNAFAQ